MNNYLIPANTKQGTLILGIFRKFDLILFGSGVGVTILLLMVLPVTGIWMTLLVLAPALITGLLVTPIPYYHNVLIVLSEALRFINTRQKLIWKGWCIRDESEND